MLAFEESLLIAGAEHDGDENQSTKKIPHDRRVWGSGFSTACYWIAGFVHTERTKRQMIMQSHAL